MKIEKIQLSNYRNFKEYSIDFGKETTIFIGKNGMGKTNLLTAISQSLSFIFAKRKDKVQYDFIASSEEKPKSFEATDGRYNYDIADYLFPSIKVNAKIESNIIAWEFLKENKTSGQGLKESFYVPANTLFWNNYIINDNIKELPVITFFHDSYPHITTDLAGNSNIQKKLSSGFPMPRNTAYYKWNDAKNCFDLWTQYFTMHWKNDKFDNGKGDKNYITAVSGKIIEFSESMSELVKIENIEIEKLEIETRGKDDVLVVVFKNGHRTPFTQLPQGYKRAFGIVFDIANRAFILNSNCNPAGVVVIDEIELHLHPSITQEILTGLKTTFPDIQFIISTHSPLVITNFKQDENNVIYKLYEENDEYKNVRIDNLYGIDYNSGLRDWMDAPYRQSYINDLKESYDYWKSVADDEMITQAKNKIEKAAGKNSELYKSLN
jgi:predicted ATPase